MRIENLWKPFKRSLFLKLILISTVMIAVTISVSGYLIIMNMSDVLQKKEIQFEWEALKNLQSFTEEEYDKMFKIVFQMNYPGSVGEILANAGGMEDKLNSNDNSFRRIKDYLRTICSYDENITDFVVVTNDNVVFYDSGLQKQLRTAVASYPFLEDPLIQDVKNNKIFIKAVRDNPSRYIHKGSDDVVTFVGNIYNPAQIEKKQTLGFYIINVSLKKFAESYTEYESNVKGDFVISNAEGDTLFSSDNNFKMEKGFNLLKSLRVNPSDPDAAELLGKKYIYRRLDVGSSGLTVTNLIPRDLLWEYGRSSMLEVIYVLLASLAVTVALMSIISYMYSNRIKLLIKYIKRIKEGNFTSRVMTRSEDEIGKLAEEFNDMSAKLSGYIQRVYSAEIEQKNAELIALQAQVNPHFLFNTLEGIRMEALKEQNDKVASMVSLLGNLFRWSVKTTSKVVEIEQEIYYVSSYLELQKLRFADRLEVDISIEDELLSMGIPKLLLQPLIENIFVHAVRDTERRLSISIEGKRNDNEVSIVIRDNGSGFEEGVLEKTRNRLKGKLSDDDSFHSHIGIANVNNRINLLFGKNYGLRIESAKDEGTAVLLTFPAMPLKEMQSHVQNPHR